MELKFAALSRTTVGPYGIKLFDAVARNFRNFFRLFEFVRLAAMITRLDLSRVDSWIRSRVKQPLNVKELQIQART